MKVLFFVALILFLGAPLLAQEKVGAGAILSWDPVTQDIEGNPETIAAYQIAAFPAGTDLVANPNAVPIQQVLVTGDVVQVECSQFLSTITHNTRVRIDVRAHDTAGNVSAWCLIPLDVQCDFKAPKPPNKLRKIWPVVAGSAVAGLGLLLARKRAKAREK